MIDEPELRLRLPGHESHDDLVLNANMIISYPKQSIDPTHSFFLVTLFPNIKKLFVGIASFYNCYHSLKYFDKFDFALLISKWNLNTLFFSNFPTDVPLQATLWTAMASLGELRNLYILGFDDGFWATKLIPSVVLSRISRLTITSDSKFDFDSILFHLSSNCTELRFKWRTWICRNFPCSVCKQSIFSTKFSERMQSLTKLSYFFEHYDYPEVFEHFCKTLQAIECLELPVCFVHLCPVLESI